MGKIRKHASHVRWTQQELNAIKYHYPISSKSVLLSSLPRRTLRIIQCKANALGLSRPKHAKRTADETREAKRLHMAQRRKNDPEGTRLEQRSRYHQNREQYKAKMLAYQRRRFFWIRSTKFKGVTALDLMKIWHKQKGRCAYTGKRLDRSAQLDHVLPKALGGADELSNLQWVCPEVNYAKRDLTHEQFLELCALVISHNDHRIQFVDAIPALNLRANT